MNIVQLPANDGVAAEAEAEEEEEEKSNGCWTMRCVSLVIDRHILPKRDAKVTFFIAPT
jgi:hypothetical protein